MAHTEAVTAVARQKFFIPLYYRALAAGDRGDGVMSLAAAADKWICAA
jgi:hypothetical protein